MARHATLVSTRPFVPTPLPSAPFGGIRRIARPLAACLMVLVLAGTPVLGAAPAVAAPGETDRTTVPNLAPGNAERDLDAFWGATLSAAGVAYSSPTVVPFSAPVATGCGPVGPAEVIAFHCAPDGAVYWSVPSYEQAAGASGDAAWVNVMSHEWSHHVQVFLGTNTHWRRVNDMVGLELEATCLGGVYVADARARGLVDDAMISFMVGMFVGGPSHGSTEQVQAAFLGGLDAGPAACGFSLPVVAPQTDPASAATATRSTTPKATEPDAKPAAAAATDAIGPGTAARVTAAAVNLRASPSLTAPVRAVLSPANRIEITGPARTADGYTWWPVTDQTTGESGYVAAPFLAT